MCARFAMCSQMPDRRVRRNLGDLRVRVAASHLRPADPSSNLVFRIIADAPDAFRALLSALIV